MPELENIKDIWKKQEDCKITFSKSDIYNMMHQKSSSAVKWILIISIIEFIVPNVILLFTDYRATLEFYERYDLTTEIEIYFGIHVSVILVFIFLFFKQYREISAENSVKELMQSIIKTRRTVKYYIYYNIFIAAIIGLHTFYKVFQSEEFLDQLPENPNMTAIWILTLLMFGFVLFLFWGLYRIVYGLFLRRLKQNYRELENNKD